MLERIRAQPGFDPRRTKVRVRFDDQDLGLAWVTDPVTGVSEELTSVSRDYAFGLSLHQHMAVLEMAKEREEDTLNDKVLMNCRALLDQQRDEMVGRGARGRRRDRTAQARFDGVGARGPQAAPDHEEAREPTTPPGRAPKRGPAPKTPHIPPLDDGHVLVGPAEVRNPSIVVKEVRKR